MSSPPAIAEFNAANGFELPGRSEPPARERELGGLLRNSLTQIGI